VETVFISRPDLEKALGDLIGDRLSVTVAEGQHLNISIVGADNYPLCTSAVVHDLRKIEEEG